MYTFKLEFFDEMRGKMLDWTTVRYFPDHLLVAFKIVRNRLNRHVKRLWYAPWRKISTRCNDDKPSPWTDV